VLTSATGDATRIKGGGEREIGQLKALQEEMERKEQLFEECSRQLQVIKVLGEISREM
jgi:hypothetical protein